jgi:hypothetical protein
VSHGRLNIVLLDVHVQPLSAQHPQGPFIQPCLKSCSLLSGSRRLGCKVTVSTAGFRVTSTILTLAVRTGRCTALESEGNHARKWASI